MNPQGPESAGLQLPTPISEQPAEQDTGQKGTQQQPEKANAAGAEKASPGPSQGMPMPAIPLPTQPAFQSQGPQGAVSNTTNSSMPAVADDNDLIEKEWVNKAKQIVERTRDDPYRQSEQLTEVKVDYMQKRYGKSIKLIK